MNVTGVTWQPGFALAELISPQLINDLLQCLVSSLTGALGGIVNRITTQRRNVADHLVETNVQGWEHGIGGDVFMGAVIGFSIFWGGAHELAFGKIIVASVIGGASGARYFHKVQEVNEARRQVRTGSAKSRTLKKAAISALEASIKEEGGNGK